MTSKYGLIGMTNKRNGIFQLLMLLVRFLKALIHNLTGEQRLKEEGNETVTNCHGLKMKAADGKMRLTDVADTEQLFRIIQSVPSPKAEPFKIWRSSTRLSEAIFEG